ncbi:MAG: ABC transporter permease [Phycisphaeraceae bacterium]|nr:ABC transporter permease [Phycisphaeraceae bacterium]
MNSKTLQIARREYTSTVATKGFLIGVLIFPCIMILAIMLIPRLISDKPPVVNGTIAVIDRSEWEGDATAPTIPDALARAYSPEVLAAELRAQKEAMRQAARGLTPAGDKAAEMAVDQLLGEVPTISIVRLPPDADVEKAQEALRVGTPQSGDTLAVVVIDRFSVRRADPAIPFAAYQLFLRTRLDDRFEQPLKAKIRDAIIQARVSAAGQNLREIRELTAIGPVDGEVVTPTGTRRSTGGSANLFLAMGFMMLLWISVFTGGQYLMTTVIEEKSSRVMEVLLSAVSPLQLMTGKILGQMAVALSIMAVYLVIGVLALRQFNLLYLLDAGNVALLMIFFFIAFVLVGSLMAAIGSAVTEVREAQALLTPVMLILIIPMMLWMPIMRSPNSTFSVVCSLVPPISPFAMVIRMAGTEPIPQWQIAASIVIGLVSVFIAIWATAKIFRIGVLMYGKPPDFRTLLRWVRMA